MTSPPSPTPPWAREPITPLRQICPADGTTIDLQATLTRLELARGGIGPQTLTLPDGQYEGQIKVIQIQGPDLLTTETFTVEGNFAGFNELTFNELGFNATLEFDGEAWQLLSGNALPVLV